MKKIIIIMLSLLLLAGCQKNENELFIYNWTGYMPDSIIEKFEKETGINVIYSTYDSNEMMYSKVKIQRGQGYDIIVPSTYYVSKMARDGLLLEIDHSKIDLSIYRQDLIDQPYDKGNKYSIPYLWGATILMYNTKYTSNQHISKWNDMWESQFKGYVLLNNDIREVFQMSLMTLGYAGNSVDNQEVKDAYLKLQKLIPSVKVFNSDTPRQPFINEEVRIGMIWGGEAYKAIRENQNLDFVYPDEGSILWVDSIVISKKSKNLDNAYKFIEFISRPEIAAEISSTLGYPTPNVEALDYLGKEYRENRLLNPTSSDLKNAQFQTDIGDGIMLYEKYWEKLKTGR